MANYDMPITEIEFLASSENINYYQRNLLLLSWKSGENTKLESLFLQICWD
jgi:hypothetical protein